MKSVHPVVVVMGPNGLNFHEISESPKGGMWVHVGFQSQGFKGLRTELLSTEYDLRLELFCLIKSEFDFESGVEWGEIGWES